MTVVTKGLVKFSEEMFVIKYRTHTINMYRLFENITKTNEQRSIWTLGIVRV